MSGPRSAHRLMSGERLSRQRGEPREGRDSFSGIDDGGGDQPDPSDLG